MTLEQTITASLAGDLLARIQARTALVAVVGLGHRGLSLAETLAGSARALVRKARTWDRDTLEHLSRVLGQIETSLRDGGARAREGPQK